MSRTRTTRADPGWRRETESSGGSVYRRFAIVVLLGGLLVAAGTWFDPRVDTVVDWNLSTLFAFVALVAGFLAAEHLTMDVNVRGIDWTISFTEIPLVIGLLTAPFPVVLAAHLIAGLSVQLRRKALHHVAYNGGVMCLEVAVPFLVFGALTQPPLPMWVAAVFATVLSPLISTVFGLLALRSIGADLGLREGLRLAMRTLVLGILNATLGLNCYLAAIHTRWGWALAALLAIAVGGLIYAYSQLLREQRDLGRLSDISLSVAKFGADQHSIEDVDGDGFDGTDDWDTVAAQIRDQLGARRVVLHLVVDDAAGTTRTVVAGETLPAPCVFDTLDRDDPLLQLPGTDVHYHQRDEEQRDVSAALDSRGAHEALVVPLRNSARLLGAIEVHDKDSRWRGFGRTDVRLLRTISSHLSTACDNRRLVAQLRHDAYHDPQSGLLNRPGFLATAAATISKRTDGHVLRVDLDVLSTVSDALGYAWGDRLIISAGRRLREQLGADVPLARLEGGSFAALLTGGDDMESTARRLRDVLSAPYPVGRLAVEASAFLGYSAINDTRDEDPDIDSVLQRADLALRTARSGDDPVREYSPTMGSIFLRRFQLVTQFRQAVERGEVQAYYQPKIALATKHVLGVEALVRWRHPEFGDLSPDEFVPAVEATGLVDVLTEFVTDQALRKAREFLDDGVRVSVSVNLSVRNLADLGFPDQVEAALAEHEVPPELLTFEITESGVMADPERALPVLRRLHALGVVLALDDFGTGYSSLAYLRQLPVDEVKIDKSFVLGMGTDLGDLAVVRSIVELGHSLGLIVVAEGVEDDVAREALLSMNCDVAQGYLISRPLPPERLESWLHARTTRAAGKDVLTLTS